MKIDYADLLSGDAIYFDGVGHLRSPYLYELKPTSGIGWFRYMLYLNFFTWDKEQIIKYGKLLGIKGLKVFDDKDFLNKFDILTIIPSMLTTLLEALSFFVVEKIFWDAKTKAINLINKDGQIIGHINRENYQEIFDVILQLNYVGLNKDKAPTKFASEEAKAKWEKAQEFLKKQCKKEPADKQNNYSLGNIISKLCCIHNTYNLLNIYNLTVFQLYDQFFQSCYLREMDMCERVYSIHGGDKFRMDDWLKQIN